MSKWTIEYDFAPEKIGKDIWEWWDVRSDTRLFRCFSQRDANWLCELLNKQCPP